MTWQVDLRFGPGAEAARCPLCGAVWGVRVRRPPQVRGDSARGFSLLAGTKLLAGRRRAR